MAFQLVVHPNHGKGPGVQMYGKYVTEQVWKKVSEIMANNWTTDPVYIARRKAGAFFQGGSNTHIAEWIFLEFWNTDYVDFMHLLNTEVVPLIARNLTEIRVNLYDYEMKGSLDMCLMVADELKCDYLSGGAGEAFVFRPENNLQHMELWKLLKDVGLKTI